MLKCLSLYLQYVLAIDFDASNNLQKELSTSFQNGARTVVVVPDTGINTHHVAFAADIDLSHTTLSSLRVTVTCELAREFGRYRNCIHESKHTLHGKSSSDLYTVDDLKDEIVYIKGTRIVVDGSSFWDESGHGTACAGAVLRANPEALLFVTRDTSLKSVMRRRISFDILSTSYGIPGSPPIPFGIYRETMRIARNGSMHFGACDNSPALCMFDATGGPPWSIGIAGSNDMRKELTSGSAPDFISEFEQILPTHDSVDGAKKIGGTSFATPLAAGIASAIILQLRAENLETTGEIGPRSDKTLVNEIESDDIRKYLEVYARPPNYLYNNAATAGWENFKSCRCRIGEHQRYLRRP